MWFHSLFAGYSGHIASTNVILSHSANSKIQTNFSFGNLHDFGQLSLVIQESQRCGVSLALATQELHPKGGSLRCRNCSQIPRLEVTGMSWGNIQLNFTESGNLNSQLNAERRQVRKEEIAKFKSTKNNLSHCPPNPFRFYVIKNAFM